MSDSDLDSDLDLTPTKRQRRSLTNSESETETPKMTKKKRSAPGKSMKAPAARVSSPKSADESMDTPVNRKGKRAAKGRITETSDSESPGVSTKNSPRHKKKKVARRPAANPRTKQNADNNRRASSPSSEATTRMHRAQTEDENSDDDLLEEEGEGFFVEGIYIPPPPPILAPFDMNKPRLVISHIVNENFKSYKGTVTIGPFNTKFSCIIGPNGSGKSNVIDSLLFVFGYRAKKIRSSNTSVLIHNSNENERIPKCQVSVHFVQIRDDETYDVGYEEIPNTRFVISRVAFRDSSIASYYTINDRRVQFKEVAKLLASHGVDLVHSRFLILQGEVEQIALMKAKAATPHETGMLEYLEEIIGTNRYKEPIEKLEVVLGELAENRKEKLAAVSNVKKELSGLLDLVIESLKYITTENRITCLLHKQHQVEMYNLMKRKNVLQNELQATITDLDNVTAESNELVTKNSSESKEMKSVSKELSTLINRRQKIEQVLRTAENKDNTLKSELKCLKKKITQLKTNIETEEEKLARLTDIPERNQAKITKLSSEESALAERRTAAEAALREARSTIEEETRPLQQHRNELLVEQTEARKQFGDANAAHTIATNEFNIYMSDGKKEKEKLEHFQSIYDEMETSLAQKENEIREIEAELPGKLQNLNESNDKLTKCNDSITKLNKELVECGGQMEEKKSCMASSNSRNKALKYLLSKRDEVPGVMGRLGDLGAVDDLYDTAVSTSGCNGLEYIITDTSETVETCLEILKRDTAGRATFLALDRQQHLRAEYQQKIKTPENVPRIFDLIRVQDERVLVAFYHVFRNTLLAEQLDQATRIAYGTNRKGRVLHRVVTLNGDLIEQSGTMSGGGQKIRGYIGQKVAVATDSRQLQKETKQLEERMERLQRQYNEAVVEQSSLMQTVEQLTPVVRQLSRRLNQLMADKERLPNLIGEQKKKIIAQAQVVKKCEPNEQKVKELQKNIEKTKKAMDAAQIKLNGIENKVKEMYAQIENIVQKKTGTLETSVIEITDEWEKIRNKITNLGSEARKAERDQENCQNKIIRFKTDLEETENKIEMTEQEREVLKEDIRLAKEKNDELKIQEADLATRHDTLQEGLKSFAKTLAELDLRKIDLTAAKEKKEGKIRSLDVERNAIAEKVEQLEIRQLPTIVQPEGDKNETIEQIQIQHAENTLVTYTEEQLEEMDLQTIKSSVAKMRSTLTRLELNENAVNEYSRKLTKYLEQTDELKAIIDRRDRCRKMFDQTKSRRITIFKAGFDQIAIKLKQLYQMLTLGGDADLELYDSLNPFTEGITFNVRPPQKSWKSITNLSGGEKTLSSLALVFALHYFRPSPLYVMDEIDAALDFRNVSIIGVYIKNRTIHAQFIVISLRTNMFELAETLTGIFKVNQCTSSHTLPMWYLTKMRDEAKKIRKRERNAKSANTGAGDGQQSNNAIAVVSQK